MTFFLLSLLSINTFIAIALTVNGITKRNLTFPSRLFHFIIALLLILLPVSWLYW